MYKVLLAGAGGFIGSIFRYLLATGISQWADNARFPFWTLTVNVIGCLIIGFLSQLGEARGIFTAEARVFIFVGILGGFTTYSSFGNETIDLWRANRGLMAIGNIAGHLILGLGAVWLGRLLAEQIQ
jgi:fluoride exporter